MAANGKFELTWLSASFMSSILRTDNNSPPLTGFELPTAYRLLFSASPSSTSSSTGTGTRSAGAETSG